MRITIATDDGIVFTSLKIQLPAEKSPPPETHWRQAERNGALLESAVSAGLAEKGFVSCEACGEYIPEHAQHEFDENFFCEQCTTKARENAEQAERDNAADIKARESERGV